MARRSPPRAGCILAQRQPPQALLVVHNRTSGFWGFPKGRKQRGESRLQTALRELQEETGRILDPSSIVGGAGHNGSHLFLAVGDFEPACEVDGREIDDYRWVTLEELRQLASSKFTRRFLPWLERALADSLAAAARESAPDDRASPGPVPVRPRRPRRGLARLPPLGGECTKT